MLPALTLVDVPTEASSEKKTDVVVYQLQVQAAAAGAAVEKYKFYVRRFDSGTPVELIVVLKAFEEVFEQNSVAGANDRLAIIRTLLRGEALSLFEAALLESRTGAGGQVAALTRAHLTRGLNGIKLGVFPFRVLEIQKLWMRRKMCKPTDMSFRKTVAAVVRINNSIPYFPGATVADKFSEAEIIELLEWSIPQTWRNKFDLEGYIPSLETRTKLVEKCEALERNEPKKAKPAVHKAAATKAKYKKGPKGKGDRTHDANGKAYFCTDHGAGKGHNTDRCFTLINREKKILFQKAR